MKIWQKIWQKIKLLFRRKKKIKEVTPKLTKEKIIEQATDVASAISPKATCKKGCNGKGYMWNSGDGRIIICLCLVKSTRNFFDSYREEHGKTHPLFLDINIVLMTWARKNAKQSPRMKEIMAKQARIQAQAQPQVKG